MGCEERRLDQCPQIGLSDRDCVSSNLAGASLEAGMRDIPLTLTTKLGKCITDSYRQDRIRSGGGFSGTERAGMIQIARNL